MREKIIASIVSALMLNNGCATNENNISNYLQNRFPDSPNINQKEETQNQQIIENLKGKFNLLKKPIISDNPNSPLIIFLAENHKHSKSMQNLIKLREILPSNTILGLEGWCGKEIDDKRKKRYTIANNVLIDNLLINYNLQFNLIGLEDEILQIEASRREIAWRYYEGYIKKRNTSEHFNHIRYYVSGVYNISLTDQILEKAKEIYERYKSELLTYNNPQQIVLGQIAYSRDKYAIEKLSLELKNKKIKLGVIVYGSYHMYNIIEHLKEEYGNNGFSLIVIKS